MIKCFLKRKDGFFKYILTEDLNNIIAVPFQPTAVEIEAGQYSEPVVGKYKSEYLLQRTFLDEFDNQVAMYEEI